MERSTTLQSLDTNPSTREQVEQHLMRHITTTTAAADTSVHFAVTRGATIAAAGVAPTATTATTAVCRGR